MADDPSNKSDTSDHVEASPVGEDAETTAARRELKQTSISEKTKAGQDQSASDDDTPADNAPPSRGPTPDTDLSLRKSDELREQISSPKKKRAHHELDENKDVAEAPLEGGATGEAAKSAGASRTDRSEPEKKRPRDRQASASAVRSGQEEVEPLSASASPRSSMDQTSDSKDAERGPSSPKPEKAQTSAKAFATSGFAKLAASTTSPFGAMISGAGKPSIFGASLKSGSASPSPFGSALSSSQAAPAAPKLSFGSAASASPFAGLNGSTGRGSPFGGASPFGSALGGSSVLGGARLTNFGKPGETLKSDKPARPFGAPDSDAEDGKSEDGDSDGEEQNEEAASDEGSGEAKDKETAAAAAADEKKKLRLQKITVDDGEGQEATLFSERAKMYIMEKGVGWKERGAGMLKVNVPKATVDIDDDGQIDPSTFDASMLDESIEGGGPKNVRLIMRQDHTLRVILNTVVLPAMKFTLTKRLKAATVLFTAFEDGEARQVQVKLSEANATNFTHLMEMIQKQLADV